MSKSRHDESASPDRPPDDRSPMARAAEWASRIMTISLEMVLPGVLGYWLDQQLGTKIVFMLLGFAFGMFVAMKHLLHAVNAHPTEDSNRRTDSDR